jgi:hypothetical protein
MSIEPDEFAAWREHPVTRAYFERVAAEQARTFANWQQIAWEQGNLSEREYAYHKARAETLDYMASLVFEDLFPKEAE